MKSIKIQNKIGPKSIKHRQKSINKSIKNQSKIDQKSIQNRSQMRSREQWGHCSPLEVQGGCRGSASSGEQWPHCSPTPLHPPLHLHCSRDPKIEQNAVRGARNGGSGRSRRRTQKRARSGPPGPLGYLPNTKGHHCIRTRITFSRHGGGFFGRGLQFSGKSYGS